MKKFFKKLCDMYVYNFNLAYGHLIKAGINPWM